MQSYLSKFTGHKAVCLTPLPSETLTLKVHRKSGYTTMCTNHENSLIVLKVNWKIGYACMRLCRKILFTLSCSLKSGYTSKCLHRKNLFILSKFMYNEKWLRIYMSTPWKFIRTLEVHQKSGHASRPWKFIHSSQSSLKKWLCIDTSTLWKCGGHLQNTLLSVFVQESDLFRTRHALLIAPRRRHVAV